MKLLLSFDIEEFDMPLEYGGEIPFEEQIQKSREGLITILQILQKYSLKATFFSTVIFAENNPDLIKKLLEQGHELASHTWFHSDYKTVDLLKSRQFLEQKFNTKIYGLRMPRLMKVPDEDVENAGYTYNSSINPTYLPGRYNDFKTSRTIFKSGPLYHIPASVSPIFRVPLFWLSFHNFPLSIFKFFAKNALRKDDYLCLYFHPWEFAEIQEDKFKLPKFTTRNSGREMVNRFDNFIEWLKLSNIQSVTYIDFVKNYQ